MISITAKHDGFRRAGIAHPTAPTDYPDDRFTAKELEQLQAEPMLVVEILESGAGDHGQGKGKVKTGSTSPVPDP